MSNATLTLTDFLLARITEDEDASKRAGCAEWALLPGSAGKPTVSLSNHIGRVATADHRADAAHIARHDPARMFADCAAKRAMIEWAWGNEETLDGEWGSARLRHELEAAGEAPSPLRIMAEVYADHPDYDQSWRP